MNREVENFLSSAYPYARSTKENYRRVLVELVAFPNLDQWDATALIEFISRPGWGNSQQNLALFCCGFDSRPGYSVYSVVKVLATFNSDRLAVDLPPC